MVVLSPAGVFKYSSLSQSLNIPVLLPGLLKISGFNFHLLIFTRLMFVFLNTFCMSVTFDTSQSSPSGIEYFAPLNISFIFTTFDVFHFDTSGVTLFAPLNIPDISTTSSVFNLSLLLILSLK